MWLGQKQKRLSADEVRLGGLLSCPALCLRTRKDMPEVYSLNQMARNSVLTSLSNNLIQHYGYIPSNKESYKWVWGGGSREKIYVHQKRAWYKPSLGSLRIIGEKLRQAALPVLGPRENEEVEGFERQKVITSEKGSHVLHHARVPFSVSHGILFLWSLVSSPSTQRMLLIYNECFCFCWYNQTDSRI